MTTDPVFLARVPLPLRPSIHPMESAQGWLLRAHEINGGRWHEYAFRRMGRSLARFMTGEDLSPASDYGWTRQAFAATTVRDLSERRAVIADEEIHRNDWTTDLRRWCPVCWRQDLDDEGLKGRTRGWRIHRRFWWDAICVLTCPIHCVRLEQACPTCGIDVKWQAGSLTTCRDGHSLMVCAPVEAAPQHVRADAYIVGRLGGAPRVYVPMLDRMTLREARETMEKLGVAAVAGAAGGLRGIEAARHPEVLSRGLEIAAGWPMALDEVLDSMAASPEVGIGNWGIDQVYGDLVAWARRVKDTLFGKEVYDAIHAHHARRAFVRRDSAAAGYMDGDAGVNVTQIAQAAGANFETVVRYLKAMDRFPPETAPGTPTLLPRSILREVVDIFEDALSVDEVAELLDVHQTLVGALIKEGILRTAPLHEKADAINRRFSRREIEALIKRIAGDAPFVDAAPEGLLPLSSRAAAIGVGGVAGIIRTIFDGKAQVVARLRGGKGLKALLVDPEDIRRAARTPLGDGMTIKEAQAFLGIHPETVYAAMEEGLIERLPHAGAGIVLKRASVEAFAATYTNTVKIAGAKKSAQREAQKRLAEAGVTPVLTKAINPRCRGAIYRVADVPGEMWAWAEKNFCAAKTA